VTKHNDGGRQGPAHVRILEAAGQLFYADGIAASAEDMLAAL
jgi:hypothetical protein